MLTGTRKRRIAARFVAISGALFLLASGSASAAQQLAQEQKPFVASTYGNRTVWSSYDPATASFRLVTLLNGVPTALPVATAAKVFDVQVGPGEDGAPVAVYSRCASSGGCDIYRFDFGTNIERKVSGISTDRFSETHPSISGHRIAFLRRLKRRGRQRRLDGVYLGRTIGNGTRRQPTPRAPRGGAVEAVTLSGRKLFFVWRRFERNEPVSHAILTRIVGHRAVEIDRIGSGGAAFGQIITPSVLGSAVYYGRVVNGKGRIWSYDLVRRSFAVGIAIRAGGVVALEGGTFLLSNWLDNDICTYNVRDPPTASSCTLTVSDPVTFNKAKRPRGEQT